MQIATMTKIRIAIDMDEVIADALTAMRSWARSVYQREWTEDEMAGRSMGDLLGKDGLAALHAHMHEGEFFRHLQVIDGAQAALRSLAADHEIFITTAAMEFPLSLKFKREWLDEHFDFLNPLNFVFCGDKSIINADFLIDDHARHFRRFVGQGILFDAHHNVQVEGFARLKHWRDAASLIENLKRR